jgi:hypothetical protein
VKLQLCITTLELVPPVTVITVPFIVEDEVIPVNELPFTTTFTVLFPTVLASDTTAPLFAAVEMLVNLHDNIVIYDIPTALTSEVAAPLNDKLETFTDDNIKLLAPVKTQNE